MRKTNPLYVSMARLRILLCRASRSGIATGYCCASLVLSSISVKRKVTVPLGRACPAPNGGVERLSMKRVYSRREFDSRRKPFSLPFRPKANTMKMHKSRRPYETGPFPHGYFGWDSRFVCYSAAATTETYTLTLHDALERS